VLFRQQISGTSIRHLTACHSSTQHALWNLRCGAVHALSCNRCVSPGIQVVVTVEQGTDREARRRRAALMGVTEEELDAEDFQLFSGAGRGTGGAMTYGVRTALCTLSYPISTATNV
jgi:hypothetical protein